jgi:biotin transport system substrate-specific component
MEVILKTEIISSKAICRLFCVAAFVVLTILGAFVRIPLPFTPVPITLQTMFVLLGGALLGSRLGSIAQMGYILLGAAGAPIFSGAGSGLHYLLGPTAGYIFGFALSAFCLGRLVSYTHDNYFFTFTAFLAADAIILLSGTLWLKLIFGYPFVKLMSIGFIPFIPGDLLKALVAAGLYMKLKNRLREVL